MELLKFYGATLLLFCVGYIATPVVTYSPLYLEDRPCAKLFSAPRSAGNSYPIRDTDQKVNLGEDSEIAIFGWNVTNPKTVTIESGCELNVCSDVYFGGTCHNLQPGTFTALFSPNIRQISSASCSCHKECRCSDVTIKGSECGRAYLKGGCNTCNSEYLDLQGRQTKLPSRYIGKVETILLREGCQLALYKKDDLNGESIVIASEITENFSYRFQSSYCECAEYNYESPPKFEKRPKSYPRLIDIPLRYSEVITMMDSKIHRAHPGPRMAYMSLTAGRSSRNAYILILGSTGAGKSSAINLLFDNPNIAKVGGVNSTTTDIHEYRISVPIDVLGVRNSELRIIDTPGLGDTRGIHQDAKFLATLDEFLSTHEELKERIPNVVLIFHQFNDNRFGDHGSNFVKLLRGLDSFRSRITDENFSNVIFVLSHFCSEPRNVQTHPEVRLAQFKDTIEKYTLFPKPIILTVVENKPRDHDLPMVNGYYQLPNYEYFPKNLFSKIESIAENAGDMIGLSVFRTAFRTSDNFEVKEYKFFLKQKSPMEAHYLSILSGVFIHPHKTEVSRTLDVAWRNLDPNLKQKFPNCLEYLQWSLSSSNINITKLEDVPTTPPAALKLFTELNQNDVTQELLNRGLGIKPPKFPQATVAGYGYNIFSDKSIPRSPFKMEDFQGSDIGFLFPSPLTLQLNPNTLLNFNLFSSREEYIRSRVEALGVEGTIPSTSFYGITKPGSNIKSEMFQNTGCSLSGTREVRLFDLTLMDETKNLNAAFESTVRNLPPFNDTDPDNVQVWIRFFEVYGTHVVKSVHGGGEIQIRLESHEQFNAKISNTFLGILQLLDRMSIMGAGKDKENLKRLNETRTKFVIPPGFNLSMIFLGGDPAYKTDDLTRMTIEDGSKLLKSWKSSLKFNPTILSLGVKLVPISRVVKNIGKNYTEEIEKVISHLFHADVTYTQRKRREINSPGPSRAEVTTLSDGLRKQAEVSKACEDLRAQTDKLQEEFKILKAGLFNKTNKTVHLEEKKYVQDVCEGRLFNLVLSILQLINNNRRAPQGCSYSQGFSGWPYPLSDEFYQVNVIIVYP